MPRSDSGCRSRTLLPARAIIQPFRILKPSCLLLPTYTHLLPASVNDISYYMYFILYDISLIDNGRCQNHSAAPFLAAKKTSKSTSFTGPLQTAIFAIRNSLWKVQDCCRLLPRYAEGHSRPARYRTPSRSPRPAPAGLPRSARLIRSVGAKSMQAQAAKP
jgi:hypothetical protein